MDELITSREFAKRIGMSPSYICRLARKANKAGYPWPVKTLNKKTLPWEAPLVEWENILADFGSSKRNEIQKKLTKPTFTSNERLYSTADAVKEIKKRLDEEITDRWLSILGKRNKEMGGNWPIKKGQAKVAPIDEWIRIMNNPKLRAWSRKKK